MWGILPQKHIKFSNKDKNDKKEFMSHIHIWNEFMISNWINVINWFFMSTPDTKSIDGLGSWEIGGQLGLILP